MHHSAKVLSVKTLEDLRLAVAAFVEEAQKALEMVDGEVRRTEQWLEDRMLFWKAEIRRWEEQVFLAKQALARKKYRETHDRPVDTTDEEKALRKAKARLEYTLDKAELTRNWTRQLSHELTEYEGPARTLKSILEADLLRACAILEQKEQDLEAYLQLIAPQAPSSADAAGGSSAAGNESAEQKHGAGGRNLS